MVNSMRTASGAPTQDTTDQHPTLPHWYSEPRKTLLLTKLSAEAAAAYAYPKASPMLWTIGHLLHGSGFTELVLAEVRSPDSGPATTPEQTVSYSRYRTALVVRCTGQVVHINVQDYPSTSVLRTDPPAYSPTGLPACDLRRLREPAWKARAFLRPVGVQGSIIPSSLKTR